MESVSPVALLAPVVTFAINSVKTGYDISSVSSETTNHLKAIAVSKGDVTEAKKLRRQKQRHLDTDRLERFDLVIRNTQEAIECLEALVEPARKDMAINFDQVSVKSRITWVWRDSNKVQPALASLILASQSLHTEMHAVRGLGCSEKGDEKVQWSGDGGQFPPPTYDEATLNGLHERRQWNAQRRLSKRPEDLNVADIAYPPGHTATPPADAVTTNTRPASAFMDDVAQYFRHNEAMLASAFPNHNTTPVYAASRFEGPSPGDYAALPDNVSELDATEIAKNLPAGSPGPSLPRNQFTGEMMPTRHRIEGERSRSPAMPSDGTSAVPSLYRTPRQYALSSAKLPSGSLTKIVPEPTALVRASSINNRYQQARSVTVPPRLGSPVPDHSTEQILQRQHNTNLASTPASMTEAQIFIPGLKKPMILRREEPADDNTMGQVGKSNKRHSLVGSIQREASKQSEDSQPVGGQNTAPNNPVICEEQPKPRFRRLRRRNPDLVPPQVPDQVVVEPRHSVHKQRPSRQEWQLEQQMADLRRMNLDT